MPTPGDCHIQPLDLIVLRGADPMAQAMACLPKRALGSEHDAHVAVAVTREILDLPYLEPGRVYLWEATLSAAPSVWPQLAEPLPVSQLNKLRYSVHLRDLERVMASYRSAGGRIDHCAFLGQLPPEPGLRQLLAALHSEAPQPSYPPALRETLGMLGPEAQVAQRVEAGDVEAQLAAARNAPAPQHAERFIFCSAWAAKVYARLDVLELPEARLAEPADFLERSDLFAAPRALVSDRDQHGQPPGASADASRPGAAAFARHQRLQERLSTVAAAQAAAISIADNRRVNIEFRADAAPQFEQAERWLSEDSALDLQRPRAPLPIADLPAPLNIVILVTGTRGDIQPFIGISRKLQQDGHRVRLATHAEFRIMVESNGLEFFPLGGDPKELISYMVRTGGKIIPTRLDLLIDEVPKKRQMVAELVASTWDACTQADPKQPDSGPFKADAIIANPPAFGHYDVAEKLGVPLHMVMTMPWSPTRAYPHPLANMDFTRQDRTENWLSYGLVEGLTYTGIGDILRRFRRRLGLPKISFARSIDYLHHESVPFTYLWSPSLLPRPSDWGSHIDIANFIFYEQASSYQPPAELAAFLEAGEPPVYVGFGSVVVEDPEGLTNTIFAALTEAGRRGIVSAGWGGLGNIAPPDNVLMIDKCPHDWLFPRCAAICHHGGAGTTSTGLRAGKPNIIVPFFGDQFFWGPIVAQAGAGPEPIPIGKLNTARLAAAFRACEAPQMTTRAQAIGNDLRTHDGAALTVKSFYRHLPTTADGVVAYLGFDADDRKQLSSGEIVLRPLQNRTEHGLGHALAARIERPLEDVYADCRAGRELVLDPLTVAFEEVHEPVSPASFAGAGFTASDSDEIEALLLARPGDQFNFSEQEYQELAQLASTHPGWSLDERQIGALNRTLAQMLYQRHTAYREAGLEGIAPYARADGKQTLPGAMLRQALPADSILAEEFPAFTHALRSYPHHNEGFESRFYWVTQNIAGQRSRSLLHKLLLTSEDYAGMSLRWYYMGRGLDVIQTFVGLARQGDATLVVSAGRTAGAQLAGRVSGKWHRWRTRSEFDDAAVRVVEALRRC